MKKALTTKKTLVPKKAASEAAALFSGGGDRHQSLSLKFAMDKTSHTIYVTICQSKIFDQNKRSRRSKTRQQQEKGQTNSKLAKSRIATRVS
jgi:hypothetical protein